MDPELQPEQVEPKVGVFLALSAPDDALDIEDSLDVDEDELNADGELGEAGHVLAWGHRGRHAAGREHRVAVLGQSVLRKAAEAVGQQVALVVGGVVAGIDRDGLVRDPPCLPADSQVSSFTIDGLDLKFGVKATLGTGRSINALLTATSEATVEVTLLLRRHDTGNPR